MNHLPTTAFTSFNTEFFFWYYFSYGKARGELAGA